VSPEIPLPSAPPNFPRDEFQPGQVALRHLLGATAVASVIAAMAASSIRSQPTPRAIEVVVMWTIVAGIATVMFFSKAMQRRRQRLQAGRTLLRVSTVSLNPGQRTAVSWLLTLGVIVAAFFMSFVWMAPRMFTSGNDDPALLLVLLGGQGALWAYCWDHWTQDVYSVEFCEHGVLTCEKLFLWSKISRIGWSPATPKHLAILVLCHSLILG
jgi:hypothetical protein